MFNAVIVQYVSPGLALQYVHSGEVDAYFSQRGTRLDEATVGDNCHDAVPIGRNEIRLVDTGFISCHRNALSEEPGRSSPYLRRAEQSLPTETADISGHCSDLIAGPHPGDARALVQLGQNARSEVDRHPVHRLLAKDGGLPASATEAPVVPVASHRRVPWVVNSPLLLNVATHFSNDYPLLACLGRSAVTTGAPGYRWPPKLPMVGSEVGWREKADEAMVSSFCCACAGWVRGSQRRAAEDPWA